MITVIKTDAGYARQEILIDNTSDVANLPTDICAGSIAYTASMDHIYQLSNAGAWTEVV